MQNVNRIAFISAAACAAVALTSVAADEIIIESAKDNTLYEDTDGMLSNGAGERIFVGRTGDGSIRRALLAFDVAAAVPAGSTINSVSLRMNMSRTIAGDHDVSLHTLTADWGEGASDALGAEGRGIQAEEGDATWIHTFYDDMFWTTEGG
ncbi:MAG: DNRLRE domain-containing protein, partial [Phycisphaerales bacterium]